MKELPSKVDLRHPDDIVYDQGGLASATACAMASAIESMSRLSKPARSLYYKETIWEPEMFTREEHCPQCNQTKRFCYLVGMPPPTICGECEKKNEEEKRQNFIDLIATQGTDEAIRALAGMVYDLRQKGSGINGLL